MVSVLAIASHYLEMMKLRSEQNVLYLQNLIKQFNGTAILASIIPPLLVLCKNVHLNVINSESVTESFGSLLQN